MLKLTGSVPPTLFLRPNTSFFIGIKIVNKHHLSQRNLFYYSPMSKHNGPEQTFGFLTQKPYSPPSWAQHLHPIPSHVFSLAHVPTPIHRWNLPNLPKNVELWIKRDDLSGMQLSGNKVRKLEFLMAEAVAQGADCIITIGGIQSNHCRATAVAAKYLNLDCYLILRTSKILVDNDPGLTGNLLVERLVGAHVDLVSKEEYANTGSEVLTNLLKERLIREGKRPYVIPVGGSNSLGTWGYIEAVREIEEQLHAKGLGYAMNTIKELEFVKEIAAATGIVLDPVYSGKAAFRLLKDMNDNPAMWEGRKVLFIHTGGLLGLYEKTEQITPMMANWRRMDIAESVPRKDGVGKMF
ncbi:hypothetical protein IFM89_013247 [Coptis chinensis]|uniref:Tryptophan synthase beta chain-like PALP domain-containing protein n=1 Tax=Coptis chinensis TaxID=261450 RepID=A0A835IVZ3_9MAGN|nr:hypothetical protein IFM89_013247 [Coptis chinensis]